MTDPIRDALQRLIEAVVSGTIPDIRDAINRARALLAEPADAPAALPANGELTDTEQTPTIEPQAGHWLPIETAPKNGTAILAICKHDADSYTEGGGCRLTAYGAWCEGGGHVSDGPNVIAWGGGYSLGDTDCPQETMPDWWFQAEGDTLGEAAACPVCWMPIPICPARWGQPPVPPAERHAAPVPAETLAARPLIEQVAAMGDCIGQQTVGQIMSLASRAASWLAENPPGQPVAIEPRGCPTPGACSCLEPAPQGGEVES